MVHAACRRPAIGAAEDRGMAESLANARKLGGDGGERFVPGYLAEAIGAGAFLSLAPAVANGGPRDAQRGGPPPREGGEPIRRRRGTRERPAADHAAVLDQRREGAPMSELGEACDGHGGLASIGRVGA